MAKIAAKTLATGDGWSANDVVCTNGPEDRPFEEQHRAWAITIVLEGSFQYRGTCGSAVMIPGSLMLSNLGHCFECRHDYGVGDRCLSFHYSPELFERCGLLAFRMQRIPALRVLAPWTARAIAGLQAPGKSEFNEVAYGLLGVITELLSVEKKAARLATAADERRISRSIRFLERHFKEEIPLARLASEVKLSEFHYLRIFREVTGLTPHQYVVRKRLLAVATRLNTGGERIIDIALANGFGDLTNFYRAFGREFGISPHQYRRLHKAN